MVLIGTSVFPIISGSVNKAPITPIPRYRDGGTPYNPSQSLTPFSLQYKGGKDAPTNGYIASPPEYSPTRGVLYCYKSSDWATTVRDCVVALTRENKYDEIAYVLVSSTAQMNSAISLFTAGGANMSKVQFIIKPLNAIWMRDYGPHFIWQDDALALVDSHYYPERPLDNFVPTLLGDDVFKLPTYDIGVYYSGGNFQPGPNRTAFLSSLINLDNPTSEGFNASLLSNFFHTYQGIDTLHILPQLPWSVDGTGHIDMWMYLVDDHTCIISQFKAGSNQQAITITNNAVPYMQALGFTVYRTPAWNVGSTHYTYTNAYRVNNRIFIPTYTHGYTNEDAEALANWTAAAGPDVSIVPINSYDIIPAAGAVHCIVMQIPRFTAATPAVHLISPNGGELFVSGTTQTIQWVATDTDNRVIPQIDLLYSTDDGASYTPITTTTNLGYYNWTVPFVSTDQARIKVVAHSSDLDQTETQSDNAFQIAPTRQTVYTFQTGAGVNKFGYGYQTLAWSQIAGIRTPVTTTIDNLVSGAYGKIAYSDATGGDTDANRYISPNPTANYESTHTFVFTINENPSEIDDLHIYWEGYAKSCSQIEMYIWDYTAGQWTDGAGHYAQNRYLDNWAGNRDGYLDVHLRSNIPRYISPSGQLTILLYTHRATYGSVHDYVVVTTSYIYRNLPHYPEYLSQVDSGASVMKTALDYLMWNSTVNPLGPPSIYDEQLLYDTYAGGDNVNASEMAQGLNAEIDDHGHGWIYGYFFAPYGHTPINEALRDICTWIDFPVDFYNDYRTVPVPKPGHTNHVPVMIPFYGDYNHWVTVKGIHTDRDSWNYTGPLTIYGFWINDPNAGGIGTNTYVTTSTLMNDYYYPLNVPGDPFNSKFVTVNDPPNIQGVDVPSITGDQVTIGEPIVRFTADQTRLLQQAQDNIILQPRADALITQIAYHGAQSILSQSCYGDAFTQATSIGSPTAKQGIYTVAFKGSSTTFVVDIDATTGLLKQIQVK